MRRLATVLALAGLAATPLRAEPAAPADRAPVALRQGPILTPRETAGSGLAPEVKLRVEVDARGRAAKVEVLAIVPASPYDPIFRDSVIATVSGWRWAPAIVAGAPTPKTLEWTLQLLALEKRQEGAGDDHRVMALLGGRDAGLEHARMTVLPPELRKSLLVSQVSAAEKLLAGERRRKVESPHFVVISDAHDLETAAVVARNLESIFNLLSETFRDRPELQPEPLKTVVYVFGQKAGYDALVRQLGNAELSAGFYVSTGLLAFHVEVPSTDLLMSTLLHEATHAFVGRHLVRPDRPLPGWLSEGLANYLGNSAIKKGRIVLGATLKSKFVLSPSYTGAFRLKTGSGWDVETVKQSMRSGERLTLAGVALLLPGRGDGLGMLGAFLLAAIEVEQDAADLGIVALERERAPKKLLGRRIVAGVAEVPGGPLERTDEQASIVFGVRQRRARVGRQAHLGGLGQRAFDLTRLAQQIEQQVRRSLPVFAAHPIGAAQRFRPALEPQIEPEQPPKHVGRLGLLPQLLEGLGGVGGAPEPFFETGAHGEQLGVGRVARGDARYEVRERRCGIAARLLAARPPAFHTGRRRERVVRRHPAGCFCSPVVDPGKRLLFERAGSQSAGHQPQRRHLPARHVPGFPRRRLGGRPLRVHDLDPRVATRSWREIQDEIRQTGSRVVESQHRRKDGSVFPVEVNVTYVRLDRDYNLAVVRDITERKRAECALIESHNLLNAIVQGTSDAVFVKDLEGRYVMINAAGAPRVWPGNCSISAAKTGSNPRPSTSTPFSPSNSEFYNG